MTQSAEEQASGSSDKPRRGIREDDEFELWITLLLIASIWGLTLFVLYAQ